MVSVEDQNLRGTGGMRLKNQIWDAARTTIEEWTGKHRRSIEDVTGYRCHFAAYTFMLKQVFASSYAIFS